MTPQTAKVLLVDDERGILETLRDILEGEGYSVAVADNGYQAVELIMVERYTFALLDYRMPGLNGVETLAEMRKVRPGLPAAFMTAYAAPELAAATEAQSLQTFRKPLDVGSLLELLAREA